MKKLILILLLISQYAFSQGIDNGKQINSELKVGIKIPVSTGVTYSAESTQYFNRMTVKPSADTLLIMAEFIDSLKLCGVWDKLDVLCLLANSDTTNALLNLKGSSYTGIRIGSPTFTPYKGITGANGKYINTRFNPVTDSINLQFKHLSASIGFFSVVNDLTVLNVYDMGSNTLGKLNALMLKWFGGLGGFLNSSGGQNTGAVTNGRGFFLYTRTANTVSTSYIDGVLLLTDNIASSIKGNANMYVCAGNVDGTATGFTNRQYALYFIGGGLTAQNVIDFNSAVSKLKTKIGF